VGRPFTGIAITPGIKFTAFIENLPGTYIASSSATSPKVQASDGSDLFLSEATPAFGTPPYRATTLLNYLDNESGEYVETYGNTNFSHALDVIVDIPSGGTIDTSQFFAVL
jgi:hypothetical protein